MVETLGLKNINMLSKDTYDGIMEPDKGELYVISGSGFGFPSSRYIDLELGANNTQYKAPANGWFYISKATANTNQYISLINVTKTYSITNIPYVSGVNIDTIMPVQKNDVIQVGYNASGTTNHFRFIYAEGEN